MYQLAGNYKFTFELVNQRSIIVIRVINHLSLMDNLDKILDNIPENILIGYVHGILSGRKTSLFCLSRASSLSYWIVL